MVFQHFELYPHMTALENIVLAQVHALKRTRKEAQARACRLLDRVGPASKADARAAPSIGGGLRRRRTRGPQISPAASSSASPSHARWRSILKPCCSTNRR